MNFAPLLFFIAAAASTEPAIAGQLQSGMGILFYSVGFWFYWTEIRHRDNPTTSEHDSTPPPGS